MEPKKWTDYEVASKVDWEGGVLSTIFWGLKAEDIENQELAQLWKKVEDIKDIIVQIENILDKAEPGEDDDF